MTEQNPSENDAELVESEKVLLATLLPPWLLEQALGVNGEFPTIVPNWLVQPEAEESTDE